MSSTGLDLLIANVRYCLSLVCPTLTPVFFQYLHNVNRCLPTELDGLSYVCSLTPKPTGSEVPRLRKFYLQREFWSRFIECHGSTSQRENLTHSSYQSGHHQAKKSRENRLSRSFWVGIEVEDRFLWLIVSRLELLKRVIAGFLPSKSIDCILSLKNGYSHMQKWQRVRVWGWQGHGHSRRRWSIHLHSSKKMLLRLALNHLPPSRSPRRMHFSGSHSIPTRKDLCSNQWWSSLRLATSWPALALFFPTSPITTLPSWRIFFSRTSTTSWSGSKR